MPDFIERTIYKMELDDSNYIRGVDRSAEGTLRFAAAQEAANKKLRESQNNLRSNEIALEATTTKLTRYRIELQNATGKNAGVQKLYEQEIPKLEAQQEKLTKAVVDSKKAYEEAAQAASRFASVAAQPQAGATGPGGQLSLFGQRPTGPAPGSQLTLFDVPRASTQLPFTGPEIQLLLDRIRELKSEDITSVFDLAADEMEAFRAAIEATEQALEEFTHSGGVFNEEFKNLAIVVAEGKAILEEFDKQTAEAARSSLGYRQQITLLHKELAVLDQANKQETKEYKNKLSELIRLKRAYSDQLQAVRILSSETRALDFGKAAITTATSAFQAYTSVAILAGGASEDLQKKTFQLFAAMQLITSLEQLHNQTKRVSVLITNAQSAAQAVYTAVIGTTTGALKALRIALLASGVGALVVGLGFLIAKINEEKEALEEAAERQKLMNDIHEQAAKSAAEAVAKLFLYKKTLTDLSIPEKERIRVVKEYNKEADTSNKINEKQINNLQLINEKLAAQNKLIIENAVSLAAQARLTEEAGKFLDVKFPVLEAAKQAGRPLEDFIVEFTALTTERNAQIERFSKAYTDLNKKEQAAATKQELLITENIGELLNLTDRSINNVAAQIPKINQAIFRYQNARQKFEDFGNIVSSLIKTQTTKTTGGGSTREIENIFEQERQRLLDRLRQISIDLEVGVRKINDEFALKFEQEQRRIAKLLVDKRINVAQATTLLDLAAEVNQRELNAALDAFNKIVLQKREQLNEELRAVQLRNTQDTLNLLQDEYDRRAQLIEFNENQELQQVKKATEDRLKELAAINPEAVVAPNLTVPITETDPERRAEQEKIREQQLRDHQRYEEEKNRIIQLGEDQETNIRLRASRERQQLALDTFDQVFRNIDRAFTDLQLIGDRAELGETTDLVNRFRRGEIIYERFRIELSKIQKKYDEQDRQNTIDRLEDEIRALERKININLDITAKEYDDLIALIKKKQIELEEARKGQITAKGEEGKPDTAVPPEAQRIIAYANAIGQLTESVIAFWQQANQAEQEALDRSIAIQERRVDAAQRIAARGNAAYLKMEEDRLKQLQVAKENAARREIGINAAVQASQLLVGITGAITRIATVPFGAETIADIAIIIGALATGFALVRSLQNNQPKFATGEKYVRRTREPAGVDTIPAWLTEGEAVISRDKNREYHPVISAIHDGTVPAPYLNKQVERYQSYKHEINNYHTVKPFPTINYERIRTTAETKASVDGKLSILLSDQNKKIDENNSLQRQTLNAMKHLSIDARIDRDGVAIAVNEYMKQMEINKSI